MDLNEYQQRARATLLPTSDNLNYLALGLASEAGEFAGKCKKAIRDGEFDDKAAMKELGDVLWYVAMAAEHLGYKLEDVARVNNLKLADRAARGKIQGNGDER